MRNEYLIERFLGELRKKTTRKYPFADHVTNIHKGLQGEGVEASRTQVRDALVEAVQHRALRRCKRDDSRVLGKVAKYQAIMPLARLYEVFRPWIEEGTIPPLELLKWEAGATKMKKLTIRTLANNIYKRLRKIKVSMTQAQVAKALLAGLQARIGSRPTAGELDALEGDFHVSLTEAQRYEVLGPALKEGSIRLLSLLKQGKKATKRKGKLPGCLSQQVRNVRKRLRKVEVAVTQAQAKSRLGAELKHAVDAYPFRGLPISSWGTSNKGLHYQAYKPRIEDGTITQEMLFELEKGATKMKKASFNEIVRSVQRHLVKNEIDRDCRTELLKGLVDKNVGAERVREQMRRLQGGFCMGAGNVAKTLTAGLPPGQIEPRFQVRSELWADKEKEPDPLRQLRKVYRGLRDEEDEEEPQYRQLYRWFRRELGGKGDVGPQLVDFRLTKRVEIRIGEPLRAVRARVLATVDTSAVNKHQFLQTDPMY